MDQCYCMERAGRPCSVQPSLTPPSPPPPLFPFPPPPQADFQKESMHDWVLGGQLVGEVKSVDGFTFVAVEAAGHMVPMDQPQVVGTTHQRACMVTWSQWTSPKW